MKGMMDMNIQELQILSPSRMGFSVTEQFKNYVFSRSDRCFAQGDQAREAIDSREALQKRQEYIRSAFLDAIGGLPSFDTPLEPHITGTLLFEGYRVEKVVFQSRPQVYVTCNLYIPDGIHSPSGAVLMVMGHAPDGKADENYQRVALHMVKAGLIVLSMDPIGQGERLDYWDSRTGSPVINPTVPDHEYAGARQIAFDGSLARYFLHDAMRAVEYLRGRKEVDPDRIGVTGSSGGGTQTTMLMMADPRIAAAAPATFVTNRREYMYAGAGQDAEQIWPGFSAAGLNHEDMLLAMAPRPVDVLAVKYDFFTIEGCYRTVENARRFYELFDKPENLVLTTDDSTHCYTPALARSAAGFFSHHLNGRDYTPEQLQKISDSIHPIEERRLNCTRSGQVTTEFPDAKTHWQEIVESYDRFLAEGPAPTPDQSRQWLGEQVFRNREEQPFHFRFMTTQTFFEMTVRATLWWTQKDLMNYGLLFKKTALDGQDVPVTIALWQNGTKDLQPHVDWIREQCNRGRAVLVLDVTAMGNIIPDPFCGYPIDIPFGALHKLCTDLFFIGDSLAAIRIYDILRAIDMVQQLPGIDGSDLSFYFSGVHGTYGRYAALIDDRIQNVTYDHLDPDMESILRAKYYDDYLFPTKVIPGMLKNGVK